MKAGKASLFPGRGNPARAMFMTWFILSLATASISFGVTETKFTPVLQHYGDPIPEVEHPSVVTMTHIELVTEEVD